MSDELRVNTMGRYGELVARGYVVRLREVSNGRWPGTHRQPALYDETGQFVRPVQWRVYVALREAGMVEMTAGVTGEERREGEDGGAPGLGGGGGR